MNGRGNTDGVTVSLGSQRREVVVWEPIAKPAVGTTLQVCVLGDEARLSTDLDVPSKIVSLGTLVGIVLLFGGLGAWQLVHYRRLTRRGTMP